MRQAAVSSGTRSASTCWAQSSPATGPRWTSTSRPVPIAGRNWPAWPGCRRCCAGCPRPRRNGWRRPIRPAPPRRRVRRWRELAAAAAVVVLALGAGAAGASLAGSGSSPAASPASQAQASHTWHKVSATDAHTGATLTVKYAPVHWGTTMAVQVAGVPSGTVCQFQVTDVLGHHIVVGGWRVEYQGRPVWYPASTSLTDASLHSFQVTVGGKVLASVNAA